ncbi:hypothetical protein N0O92_08535 [Alkalihalobacillus sp. MEB130]|uniref:hypothetical protein n=1 Tax=Alkalihalobacillus sp. MEB130 TaxID=2976704 RepID=UPI0028DFC212|nr:hypothetical protein [Alkalihalobacillus sp. MEB130]MDT8860279.1 hypothetical protein [Alkalihalobacillus sp. MEB130]
MSLSDYGKTLSNLGKNIQKISRSEINSEEECLTEKIRKNLSTCDYALKNLKDISPPTLLMSEHHELVEKFENLKNAYSLQLESIDEKSEIDNMATFNQCENRIATELNLVKPILLNMVVKVATLPI